MVEEIFQIRKRAGCVILFSLMTTLNGIVYAENMLLFCPLISDWRSELTNRFICHELPFQSPRVCFPYDPTWCQNQQTAFFKRYIPTSKLMRHVSQQDIKNKRCQTNTLNRLPVENMLILNGLWCYTLRHHTKGHLHWQCCSPIGMFFSTWKLDYFPR